MTDPDLILAVLHHAAILGLAAVLGAEMALLRPEITAAQLRQLAGIDAAYGVLALVIIVVGFSRAVFAAKGWGYYSANAMFWAKIATFALVGLLSVRPTLAYARWRRALVRHGAMPDTAEITRLRPLLHTQLALLAAIALFAAAMARGYGSV